MRRPYTSTVDNLERDYFLYLPKGYDSLDATKKWPVLLFLHGDGERGNGKNDLDYLLIHGPVYEAWIQKRDLPFIMIMPQLHMFGRDTISTYIKARTPAIIPQRLETGVPDRQAESVMAEPMTGAVPDANFPDGGALGPPNGWEKVEQDLMYILNDVSANYQTDADRLYLTGLSYGGFGTWYMASKHPELFAAINPIVGWGHPDLMEPIATAKIPVWAFCGGRDPYVKTKFFFEGINKLEKLGHDNVRFTIHEDMGHDVWRRVYGGEDIYQWFMQYARNKK